MSISITLISYLGQPLNKLSPEKNEQAETVPLWQQLIELSEEVPAEEWDKVPTDLAENLDHYLYGSPKRPK
jgi:hypothetical protein